MYKIVYKRFFLSVLSNCRGLVIICLLILFVSSFQGCAFFTKKAPGGGGYARIFSNSFRDTWDGVINALGSAPIASIDNTGINGSIKTGWIETLSDRERDGLFFGKKWKARYRLRITVTSLSAMDVSTEVSIHAMAEEKAPGGMQSNTWQRKATNGLLEKGFLQKIETWMTKGSEF